MAVGAKGLPWPMDSNSGPMVTLLALLLLSSLGLLLPMIAAQPGFINIDCGGSRNYTDPNTKLVWTTDDAYISTGINRNVSVVDTVQSPNLEQMYTARYFQQESRKKHCYVLPVTSSTSYLIRASFLFGDLEVSLPSDYSFNLSIDATVVKTVSITTSDINTALYFEFVVASTSQQIAFCVIPVVGDAFLSSLELKTLEPDMYLSSDVMFNSKYMKNLYRYDCGGDPALPTGRYGNDSYDRFWSFPTVSIDFINTTANIDLDVSNVPDRPPLKVMQTAWSSPDGFYLPWNLEEETTNRFYIDLYFAEIGTPNASDVRTLDVDLNDDHWRGPYNVTAYGSELWSETYNYSNGIWDFWDVITEDTATIHLKPNSLSTLPPLLNAAELYAVYDTIIGTETADVSTLFALSQDLNLLDWTGDPCLPVPWDWLHCSSTTPPQVTQLKLSGYKLTGTIPTSIANLTHLTDVWLDNNNLTGSIPNLARLAELGTLHLQNNSLTGTIPASLADISSLHELFLQGNNLSGPVPTGLLSNANNNGLNLTVDSSTNSSAPPPSSSNNTSVNTWVVVVGVLAAVLVIFIAILIFFWCREKKKTKTQSHPDLDIIGPMSQQAGGVASHHMQTMMQAFSQAKVVDLTDNFREKIGEGGFGPVYYGKLATGEEIAVKVNSATSTQGSDEFFTEVNLLSRVHHSNLVSLVGFCCEDDKRILLYEYMQNGTLREHLYGKGLTKAMTMDWRTRLSIALDAARGLEYLHYDCSPKIIHRDVKSNNILLNKKYRAKVADFGISKLTSEGDTISGVSTMVRGTTGYMDPEYFATNKITPKSDVYAFGVVLLEIISGRAPNNNQLADPLQCNLIQYARGSLRYGNLDQILDPSLRETSSYNIESVWKLAELAIYCVQPLGNDRPDMRQVVRELVEAINLEHMQDLTITNPIPTGLGVTALLEDHDNFSQSSYASYTTGQAPSGGSASWDTPMAR